MNNTKNHISPIEQSSEQSSEQQVPLSQVKTLAITDEPTERQTLRDHIEVARQTLQSQIEMLKQIQIDDEQAENIEALQEEIRTYDALALAVDFANTFQLKALSNTIKSHINQTSHNGTRIAANATAQSAHILMEMTAHEVHAFQVRLNQQSLAFRQYEQRSSQRIEQLAQQKGIDITTLRTNRVSLLEKRSGAQSEGDRVGVFKWDALLALNNYQGFVKVGAPEQDIDRARNEAEEARQRYLIEAQIQAMQEGRKLGLSGQPLNTYIIRETHKADAILAKEGEHLAKINGVQSELETLAIQKHTANRAVGDIHYANTQELDLVAAEYVQKNANVIMGQKSITQKPDDSFSSELSEVASQADLPNLKSKAGHEKSLDNSKVRSF